jgi:hypothetical protein
VADGEGSMLDGAGVKDRIADSHAATRAAVAMERPPTRKRRRDSIGLAWYKSRDEHPG